MCLNIISSQSPIQQAQGTFSILPAILSKTEPRFHVTCILNSTMLLTAQMFPILSVWVSDSLSTLLCSHFISKDSLPPPSSLTFCLYLFFGGTNCPPVLKNFVFLFHLPNYTRLVFMVTYLYDSLPSFYNGVKKKNLLTGYSIKI